MQLSIDTAGAVPIYVQIVEQVKRHVAAGRLKPEAALPSVRQLALDLTVNPNTIARAYLELEHEGVIYKRQGQGTYVSAQAVEASRRERRQAVAALLDKAIDEAAHAGLSAGELETLYRQAMRRAKLEPL